MFTLGSFLIVFIHSEIVNEFIGPLASCLFSKYSETLSLASNIWAHVLPYHKLMKSLSHEVYLCVNLVLCFRTRRFERTGVILFVTFNLIDKNVGWMAGYIDFFSPDSFHGLKIECYLFSKNKKQKRELDQFLSFTSVYEKCKINKWQ